MFCRGGDCSEIERWGRVETSPINYAQVQPQRAGRTSSAKLSHYDEKGRVRMVDVTAKAATSRTAQAHAFIRMERATISSVRRLKSPKGNPLEIARIAGIGAAKRTAELIPLCHPLALTHVDVNAKLCQNGIELTSRGDGYRPDRRRDGGFGGGVGCGADDL